MALRHRHPLSGAPGEAPPPAGVAIARSAELVLREPGRGDYRLFIAWPAEPPPPGGYPVIYHLDGNADFGTFVDSVRAQGCRPAMTGTEPGLVVGIGYPTDQPIDFDRRALDYTPPAPADRLGLRPNGEPWPANGGAAGFQDLLFERIMPEIARRFPVDDKRQSLFGHSFGGLFVLYSLVTAPGRLRNYIASSPSLWWGGRVLFERLADLAGPAGPATVRISVGGLEQTPPLGDGPEFAAYARWMTRNRMIDNAREFCARLAAIPGLEASFHIFEGEHHGSVAPAAISRAIRLAFGTGAARRLP